LDDGIKRGFFQDHLAFVLGLHRADDSPIAPGKGFNVTAIDGVFWRASYLPELGGKPGQFGQNPRCDPVLPHFETDEWGSWYSVWLSEPVPGGYLALTMDIEASAVRTAMISAAQRSALLLAVLALLAALVARYISGHISRPVAALRDGALAVAAERYEHRVKVQGPLEVAGLIKQFNLMTGKLAERVNLLQTLEKMLSKELAAAAARHGLHLGGEEAECSVLFTDFANFPGTTETMRATEIVGTLNAYFSVLIPIIKRNGGLVDKYIGDAIVAFFGAPVPLADGVTLDPEAPVRVKGYADEVLASRLWVDRASDA
jgi:HAMP domain-containing protein